MPKPPVGRSELHPGLTGHCKKTSSSHQEGCDRNWLINTKEFISNEKGELVGLKTVEVTWKMTAGQRPELVEKKVLREYGPAIWLYWL
jgi:glutamate synthase (NADPH/NADH) small chain